MSNNKPTSDPAKRADVAGEAAATKAAAGKKSKRRPAAKAKTSPKQPGQEHTARRAAEKAARVAKAAPPAQPAQPEYAPLQEAKQPELPGQAATPPAPPAKVATQAKTQPKAQETAQEAAQRGGHTPDVAPAPKAEAPEAAEKPKTPEKAAKAQNPGAETAPGAPAPQQSLEGEDENLSPEELARVATISRTAQLSIEKILEGAALRSGEATEEATVDAPPAPPAAPPEPTLVEKIGRGVGGGLISLAKWLLLVLLFIAVIAGGGVAWMYNKTTPAAVPTFTVRLNGVTLEPKEYEWNVPVVGSWIRRTFADKAEKSAAVNLLDAPLETDQPTLSISPAGYDTALTIKNGDGTEVFSGTAEEYKDFAFAANDNYTATLSLRQTDPGETSNALVTGKQEYAVQFSVLMKPTIRLNTNAVQQGGVAAVRVTGLSDDQAEEQPTFHCDIAETAFAKSANGWVAFVPVKYDQELGEYPIEVAAGGYTETLMLTVRARTWNFKDYTSQSQFSSPYLALADTPQEVQNVLSIFDPQVYWTANGFVQPFLTNITVKNDFGLTEYVGRTSAQRAKNQSIAGGRTFTNVVITTSANQDLITPADGRVVLAKDLGGTAGNTVVVEHGAGLKSIFYNLRSLSVEEGQIVVQGQPLGKTNATMLAEARIGAQPVEPLTIWRGQCDAVRYL
ncbi:MAG: M23 family metallopeptidase [Gemmiger sp.]|nr:M23 family metallopeptidase [Gemmiger sp.]